MCQPTIRTYKRRTFQVLYLYRWLKRRWAHIYLMSSGWGCTDLPIKNVVCCCAAIWCANEALMRQSLSPSHAESGCWWRGHELKREDAPSHWRAWDKHVQPRGDKGECCVPVCCHLFRLSAAPLRSDDATTWVGGKELTVRGATLVATNYVTNACARFPHTRFSQTRIIWTLQSFL